MCRCQLAAKQLRPVRYLRSGHVGSPASGLAGGKLDETGCNVIGIDRLDTETRWYQCHREPR